MESVLVMETNEEFVVMPNGMKILKNLVEKANQHEKTAKKISNHNDANIRKKEDAKPLTKHKENQNISQHNKNIIYHAVPGKEKPLNLTLPKMKISLESKKKESKKKKSRKRENPSSNVSKVNNSSMLKSIPLGSFVRIEKRDVYRVMAIDKDGFYIHSDNCNERYIRYSEMEELGIDRAPNMHMGKLKLEYKQKSILENKLLYGLNKDSIDIIIDTVFKAESYLEMKPYLVPDIFDEVKWDKWVTKIRNTLGIAIGYSHTQDMTENEVGLKKIIIRPQDFVVMVHTFFCSSKGHNLQTIQAEIITKAFDGKGISSFCIPAGYCKQCNRYYILSSVYEDNSLFLKHALCDFVKDTELNNYLKKNKLNSREFSQQSILNRCGYSVSRNNHLLRSERLQLLESIIAKGILSREEVKSFLNWLIRFHGSNPTMHGALIEWEMDLKGIARDSESKVVLVNRIISKY